MSSPGEGGKSGDFGREWGKKGKRGEKGKLPLGRLKKEKRNSPCY